MAAAAAAALLIVRRPTYLMTGEGRCVEEVAVETTDDFVGPKVSVFLVSSLFPNSLY